MMNDTSFDFDEVINRRIVPALKTHPMVLGEDGLDLFAAGVADMDFNVSPVILNALQQRLNHEVFGYEALPETLLPALTKWLHKRHGWEVNQDHILRAPNILNSLAIAASIFTNRGDGVILQPPVFFDFYDIIKENQREIVPNPLIFSDGMYEIDFEGLERLAADDKNKMLFLCNPHNPIGRVWRKDELTLLGDICLRNGVIVVADEIHGDITFTGHPHTPFASLGLSHSDNSITLTSPAKTFNIAACCSSFTIISNDTKRNVFAAESSRLTVNKNNAFASVAMEAAYRSGGPWLDAVLIYLEDNLHLVRQCLANMPGVKLIEPEGTFLIWLDFRGLGMKGQNELTEFLRNQAQWAITRGQAFGTEGIGFSRLNIACPRAKLKVAFSQLSQALQLR
ncbi:MAG: PatB family C-S lyase [Granulosicoccaceae bacterium]